MACREFGEYYTAMTSDMGSKLSGYFVGLQSRFGDPRVYAAQRQQMAAQEAAAVHGDKKRAEQILEHAYSRQAERNRATHDARMSKRRENQTGASRPGSERPPPPTRSAPPRPKPASVDGATRPSPSE